MRALKILLIIALVIILAVYLFYAFRWFGDFVQAGMAKVEAVKKALKTAIADVKEVVRKWFNPINLLKLLLVVMQGLPGLLATGFNTTMLMTNVRKKIREIKQADLDARSEAIGGSDSGGNYSAPKS